MSREDSDEAYVIDLCDALLGSASVRQARFDFLLGDVGKNGRQIRLPVDAYWESLKLVVEYRERQHYESVPPHGPPPYRQWDLAGSAAAAI